MRFGVFKLRSALGNVVVAHGQIKGIFDGLCKDTPEARQEALDALLKAMDVLQKEAALVESGQTPTLRGWNDKGEVVFDGSVPFEYPTVDVQPVVTKEAVKSLTDMIN